MKNAIVDICKMPFSDVEFFLRAELEQYNVMNFEFVSKDIDSDFITLVSNLKGWYSAFIIQKAETDYFKVTFVTKVSPGSFVNRIKCLSDKKGGICL